MVSPAHRRIRGARARSTRTRTKHAVESRHREAVHRSLLHREHAQQGALVEVERPQYTWRWGQRGANTGTATKRTGVPDGGGTVATEEPQVGVHLHTAESEVRAQVAQRHAPRTTSRVGRSYAASQRLVAPACRRAELACDRRACCHHPAARTASTARCTARSERRVHRAEAWSPHRNTERASESPPFGCDGFVLPQSPRLASPSSWDRA